MRYTLSVFLAFTVALTCTFLFMMNGQFNWFILTLLINKEIIAIPALIIAIISYKKIMRGLKTINRYSWIIVVCYLSGTLAMEYQTYKFSVPFEGIFITFPLVLAFIYWSQKNNEILFLSGSKTTKKDGFKTDIFLISTSFLLAGFLSLMMDLNNGDLRAFWPFLIFFISLYGFVFSLVYSITGLAINNYHKKYTLFFSSVIIFIFSLLSLFPKKIWIADSKVKCNKVAKVMGAEN